MVGLSGRFGPNTMQAAPLSNRNEKSWLRASDRVESAKKRGCPRFYGEHRPPHFHVRYGEHQAVVRINDLVMTEGWLPARVLGNNQIDAHLLGLARILRQPPGAGHDNQRQVA